MKSTDSTSLRNIVRPNTKWRPGELGSAYTKDRTNALSEALSVLERRSPGVFPNITSLSTGLANLNTSDAQTGLSLSGTNLLGESTRSTGTSGSGAGSVRWDSVLPGAVDEITVTIATDSGLSSGAVAIDWDAGDRILAITHNAATAANVVAAVAADALARYFVKGTVLSAGTIDNSTGTTITGGSGEVPTLLIGAVALVGEDEGYGVTWWDDTSVTFDYDATGDTDGAQLLLAATVGGYRITPVQLTVNPKVGTRNMRMQVLSGTGNGSAQVTSHSLGAAVASYIISVNGSGSYSAVSSTDTTFTLTVTNAVEWSALIFAE